MMFIKMFKLLAICVLCFNMYTQARSVSLSQVGDVIIERSDDKWKCDKIECPPETDRCFVSKSNKAKPSVLKRVNYCYSRDNVILKQHVSETPVDPKSNINMQLTTTRHGNNIGGNNVYYGNNNGGGNNYYSGSMENFDAEKFNREMDEMEAYLNSQMEKMDREMEKQMEQLHSNLEKMQYNLDHMFD